MNPVEITAGEAEGDRVTGGGDGDLVVELAGAGSTVFVQADQSILEALLDADVDVPFSCMEGICGSCRTTVLDGVPRHRDSVLTPAERAAGDMILICCSRAEGGRIVLDL